MHSRQIATTKPCRQKLAVQARHAAAPSRSQLQVTARTLQKFDAAELPAPAIARPVVAPECPTPGSNAIENKHLDPVAAVLDPGLRLRKLPSCAVPVELSHMVPTGGKKVVRIFGHDILLARTIHGQLLAWDDECPHAGASLSQGSLRGSQITCCYHGSTYDKRGECVSHRAGAAKTYDVSEVNGVIFVGLRGIAGADKYSSGERIPFMDELGEPGFDLVVRRKDMVKNHFTLMYANTASVEHLTGVHHIPVEARNVRRFNKTADTLTTEFEQPFEPGSPIAKIIGADHIIARINERPPFASFVELRAPFVELTATEQKAKREALGRPLKPEEMRRSSNAGEGKRGQIFMFSVPTDDKGACELITIYRLNAIDFSFLGENAVRSWITKITSKLFVEPQVLKAIVEDRDVIEKQKYREGDNLRAFHAAGAERMRALQEEDRKIPKPKVAVFGASGATGRAAVQDLLDAGHRVTAFVRNPAAFKMKHVRLKVVKGDVCNAEQVQAVMPGHEAVFMVVGATPGKFSRVASEGTRVVVDAMEQAGVRRLVCVTSYGLGGTLERLNKIEQAMYHLAMKDQLEDKTIQEAIIAQSSLDWTLLRPRMLSNKVAKIDPKNPGKDPWAVFASAEGESRGSSVSRAAVAHFAVEALSNTETHGKAYALSQE